VCDDFFIESLNRLSSGNEFNELKLDLYDKTPKIFSYKDLNLKEDVAGVVLKN
jgi:hypothetical protein